jgi:glutathione synthase/RimK-type ligase-like ATP-grasp enzyme
MLNMYTSSLTHEDISKKETSFFPSLLQSRIIKWIEIRIFFINDKFYSMAIFSQQNTKTIEDFRNYNYSKLNRMIPYNLPEAIIQKIRTFIKYISLNTGSIDMIVTHNKEYVFLEVNPCGNIEMVSKYCNYPIEKEIASYLAK